MDQHSSIDKGLADAPPQSAMRGWPGTNGPDPDSPVEVRFPGEDGGRSLSEMAERDLGATLQLLAERAQYITGSTGAAIALRDSDELVCKASAGESAPAVGTLLQVNSGLSGESVRTGQTLVCENAATDGRVNRESCQALGIASVVVMPLLREGAVMGVFELFSGQPHAFGERDLMALERLGSMVHTALDCAQTVSETPHESAVVIPMAPPAAVSSAKVETPGNELFERNPPPGGPLSSTGASAKTAGPQLAYPRIAFHGRTAPSPALDRPPEEPATLPAPEGEEATAMAGALEQAAERWEASEPEPAGGTDRNYLEPDAQAEPAPAEAMTTSAQEVAEASALPAPAPAAPQRDATAEVVRADSLATGHAAPAANREISALFEANVPVAPVPAGPNSALLAPLAPASAPPTSQPVAPVASDPKARSEVANLGRCQTCGFPISPGRVLCLDCEKRLRIEGKAVPVARAPDPKQAATFEASSSAIPDGEASVPLFLAGEKEEEPDSWLSSHKYLVAAIAMAVIGIVALLLSR
ncbi:MAG TPA: GAF domain-containing protein [Terriglobales bacterium]|nr:GAF domain-containing protein [Terriglobales bacterium]